MAELAMDDRLFLAVSSLASAIVEMLLMWEGEIGRPGAAASAKHSRRQSVGVTDHKPFETFVQPTRIVKYIALIASTRK